MNSLILETERLILRRWTANDAKELYELASDSRVSYPCGWKAHTNVDDSLNIINTVLSENETYAIVLKDTRHLIGSVGLHFDSGNVSGERECELGYWIGVPFWKHGYATEAAERLIEHAFIDLKVTCIVCLFADGNTASERVQRKLGFKYVRTVNDFYVKAVDEKRKCHVNVLTFGEWLKNNSAEVIV